jgi:hypothetical protein
VWQSEGFPPFALAGAVHFDKIVIIDKTLGEVQVLQRLPLRDRNIGGIVTHCA